MNWFFQFNIALISNKTRLANSWFIALMVIVMQNIGSNTPFSHLESKSTKIIRAILLIKQTKSLPYRHQSNFVG